jgi:hypothetical protein
MPGLAVRVSVGSQQHVYVLDENDTVHKWAPRTANAANAVKYTEADWEELQGNLMSVGMQSCIALL